MHICEVRSFAEKDIDVWLAEELRVNSPFARWFATKCDCPSDLDYPAQRTRIGVMGENNETDVEALFARNDGSGTWALLVENKVQHSISRDQLARYAQRGLYGQNAGLWDAHSFVVFAPTNVLKRYAAELDRTPTVSIEEAADFLLSNITDLRSQYRAEFLARSATRWPIEAQGNDQYQVAFWEALLEAVEAKYPSFFALSKTKFPKTTYIAANCIGAPKYFRVDLKGHMGEVDLAFSSQKPSELIPFLYANKPETSEVVFNKKSVALQIRGLPKFLVSDGVAEIERCAMPSFDAAHSLLAFWVANREFFDSHYARND